jgi:hypothetical protein
VTMRTERPPVRPRSGRRPLPPLIFLLVLALAALGVWWNVLRTDGGSSGNAAKKSGGCSSTAAPAAAPAVDPATINVRVLNATTTSGLATDVADELRRRRFVVDEVTNDASGRTVTGPGEIRHGPRGKDAAAYVALLLPGATDFPDTRATAQVDLVLGPDFRFPGGLASADAVASAAAPASGSAGC